jgi:hypothetical protein
MKLKKVNKLLLTEALGVPDDIDMVVHIYTDLIISVIENNIKSQAPDVLEFNEPQFQELEGYEYSFEISPKESWEYLKNSPKYDKEEWRKFPTYRNKIFVVVKVLPDEFFDDKKYKSPMIEASHIFVPKDFKIRTLKTKGEVYDISTYEFTIHMRQSQTKDFESIRNELSAVVSHEVFHAYQLFKINKSTGKVGYGKESTYNSLQQIMRSNINNEWNGFLRRLYLSLRFEQQARAPQLYYTLKGKGIKDYDDFMREFEKTELSKEINFLKSFSVDDMIDSITKIESFFDLVYSQKRAQEVSENLENWNEALNYISESLRQNGVTVNNFRGLSPSIRNNPRQFFIYWKKRFNDRADELFRKAVRLWDKVKED